jgi:hypothetical protein
MADDAKGGSETEVCASASLGINKPTTSIAKVERVGMTIFLRTDTIDRDREKPAEFHNTRRGATHWQSIELPATNHDCAISLANEKSIRSHFPEGVTPNRSCGTRSGANPSFVPNSSTVLGSNKIEQFQVYTKNGC